MGTTETNVVDFMDALAGLPGTDDERISPKNLLEAVGRVLTSTDHSNLTRLVGGRVELMASTDELGSSIASIQSELSEGPCVAAMEAPQLIVVEDFESDERWPGFRDFVLGQGIRSALTMDTKVDEAEPVTLNLFADRPGVFDVKAVEQARLCSAIVRVCLKAAREAEATERVGQLEQALQSRDTIGQAKGILMERERCTADEAFDMLRVASQHINRKLRDVASDLVAEAEGRANTRNDR